MKKGKRILGTIIDICRPLSRISSFPIEVKDPEWGMKLMGMGIDWGPQIKR